MKKTFITIILAGMACSAFAGKFTMNSYGPSTADDIVSEN
jgi:FlaG/FlaF family flagellin (archaellin)